ncbi:zona pellucida sperm-binding protein 2-like [Salvelinus fontinalis]|uniref:zona pellucida sperm-binding protein 2-like n=1 Tax=Salvelinus fontinalis TaxID=8038 RepID=UPI0024858EA5|nr:zona pellucida sperm-binding protein 2-like [Salvelinus fontinalis]
MPCLESPAPPNEHAQFSVKRFFITCARQTLTPPLNPNNLAVKGQPQCSPVATSADTAVFKIGVRECGTRMMTSIILALFLFPDESFTSFLPEDQLPLTLYLRKPVYVEVSIAPPSPDPSLSLRVRDCFAYPASRHSVWTLLYDGSPNPLDNMRSSVPVDSQGKTTSHSQVRRFDVKTFSFVDPETGNLSVEEHLMVRGRGGSLGQIESPS